MIRLHNILYSPEDKCIIIMRLKMLFSNLKVQTQSAHNKIIWCKLNINIRKIKYKKLGFLYKSVVTTVHFLIGPKWL